MDTINYSCRSRGVPPSATFKASKPYEKKDDEYLKEDELYKWISRKRYDLMTDEEKKEKPCTPCTPCTVNRCLWVIAEIGESGWRVVSILFHHIFHHFYLKCGGTARDGLRQEYGWRY